MLKQTIEIHELFDDARVTGAAVAALLKERGLEDLQVVRINGPKGGTDFIKAVVPGSAGKRSGGKAPTLGIIGRLGGIGARPERIGLVSDADGAVAAVACALKLADMAARGDRLPGDVIVCTHICPDAPTQPHEPVAFMGSPVEMEDMNEYEVDPAMDAILSIDTTKGNRIINHRGFAVSPTVVDGWVLRVSEDLLDQYEWSTGRVPAVLPITTQDITPYANNVFHVNSIMQPCCATKAPVVGVAITAVRPVPGCGTGASRETDIEEAARFCLEVAKAYGAGKCSFYDEAEHAELVRRYGALSFLSTVGKA